MKLKDNNLMVDFETLDSKPHAIILSVGIVLFNDKDILRQGYSEFKLQRQIDRGRTVSKSTKVWWLKTNPKEYKRLTAEEGIELTDWVDRTSKKLWEKPPRAVWSRGSFDYLILQNLFGEKLFPYYRHRDVRTLDEFGIKMKKNNHNALSDCLGQIEYVREVFSQLKKG